MTDSDWNERRLCDDGGCAGVIGGDGRCHVCGRASQFWGDERRRGLRDDDDADDEANRRREARALPAAEGEIAERRLCPDGGCTGLIGDDGCCRDCGRRDDAAPRPVKAAVDGVDGDRALASSDALVAAGARRDDHDEDERRLCSDGACTGLIGGDGRCKVCGQPAEV